MRLLGVAVAVGAAALVVGFAGRTSDARLRLVGPPVSPPLLAIRVSPYGAKLVTVDPATLEPRRGPSLEVGFHTSGWSFSADRTRLALGDGQGRLLVADPHDLRRSASFDPGGPWGLVASAWDGDRLLTLSRSPTGIVARTIDWPRRRVVAKSSVRGQLQAVAHAATTIALVLAPLRGLGKARLALVGSDSSVRTVVLDRLRVGTADLEAEDGPVQVVRHADAGLAVGNGHAYVVSAGAPVADVEVASLRVSYHEPRRRSSLVGRVADWLEPPAHAKGAPDGPNRSALWLGNGMLAIFGTDDHGTLDGRGRSRLRVTSAGVTVVDTRSWTITSVIPEAARVAPADGLLLTFGASWDSRRQRETGIGLGALGRDSRERFHVLGADPVWDVQVVGRFAVVGRSRSRFHGAVVDLRTGRVVSRSRPWPLRFLVGEPLHG